MCGMMMMAVACSKGTRRATKRNATEDAAYKNDRELNAERDNTR